MLQYIHSTFPKQRDKLHHPYLLKSTQIVGKGKEEAKQEVAILHTLTLTLTLALDAPEVNCLPSGLLHSSFSSILFKMKIACAPAVRGKDKPAAEICETNSKAPEFKGNV